MNGVMQPLYIRPGEYEGEIIITVPITNEGEATDVTVKLYVYYAGRFGWPLHGELIAEYQKDVHFEEGEAKEVEFTHTVVPSGFGEEANRDVGVEIFVDGQKVASEEFDDVYSAPGGGIIQPTIESIMEPMMGMMMMGMMMMMVVSMTG